MTKRKTEFDKNKRFQIHYNVPVEIQDDFIRISNKKGFEFYSNFVNYCVKKVVESYVKLEKKEKLK